MSRARELSELATAYDSGGGFGFRNRIINGDMRIDQRNAGASVALTDGLYYVDRWKASISQTSKLTGQQSSTAPAGFVKSLSATVGTAFTPGAGDYAGLIQAIEGNNVADLGFGTANASTVTLSFWVRSSVTGTYSVALHNGAADRSYVTTYTVNSANTWEQKSVTIAGDTSGTWTTNNTQSITAYFTLGMGSTYGGATANTWNASLKLAVTGQTQWVSTAGATFYITGVQLEAGSVASPFERRDYGRELIMCQRYCFKLNADATDRPWAMASAFNGQSAYGVLPLPVTMRATPTVTFNSTTTLRLLGNSTGVTPISSSQGQSTPDAVELVGDYSSITAGYSYWFRSSNAGDWILGTAEL